MVAAMFEGTLVVSDDISVMPTTTVVVEEYPNIK